MWDPIWDLVYKNQSWGKYPAEDLIRFVANNFFHVKNRRSVNILEIGCGPGGNLWFFNKEGFSFCGIDGSSIAIQEAMNRLDEDGSDWRDKGALHIGDITTLPFPNNFFDAVIDNECVYCNDFDTSVQIYNEAARVTKQGGKLFCRTFAADSFGDKTGIRIAPDYWACSEGPSVGKGNCRFTSKEQLPILLQSYFIDSVESLNRTITCNDKVNIISELIVYASKI